MEGRFNGGFLVLRVWGAYIWRGLFAEFYGISIVKNLTDFRKIVETDVDHSMPDNITASR